VEPVLTSSPTAAVKALGIDHPAGGFIRPYQRELAVVGRAIDLAIVAATLRASMALAGWDWDQRHTLLAAVGCILFYLSAEGFKVYDDRRSIPLRFDLRNLLSSWALTAVAILFLAYAFKVSDRFSRAGVMTWFVMAPIMLATWQLVLRAILTKVRALGYNMRRVAIVGAGEHGMRLARAMRGAPWMGLRLVGVFDDRAPASGRIPNELPADLLGTTADLPQAIARKRIDMVYVTLPINDTERISRLVTALADTTTSLYFVPDMFLFSMFNGRWVRIGDLPAVSVFETPFYGVGEWIKRVEDLLLSSLVLLVAGLPMLAVAAAIRLTSPGPALFRQRRYGLDGQEFRMWKFRTMTVVEDDAALQQATREDPRVTPIGRFLRRTSLDELPQFLNVLAGTMSVVGPRPHATVHNEYYRRLVRHYMVRHKVRPGITGWAQVNGLRGETDTLDKMEARVEYDLWYIRNWSVLLDLKVVAMTVGSCWRDRHAF
jgi:putative colanic acid biosynthesis UDP-glucose lipid carrier transferase